MGTVSSSCLEDLETKKKPGLIEDMADDMEKGCNRHHRSWLRKQQHPENASTEPESVLEDRCGKASHRGSAEVGTMSDEHHHRQSILRCVGKAGGHAVHGARQSVKNFLKGLEDFLFPRNPLHAELIAKQKQPYGSCRTHVRGGVLLEGCSTPAEHYRKMQKVMDSIATLHGAEGLRAAGLEFRVVLCAEHRPPPPCMVPHENVQDMTVDEVDDEDAADQDENDCLTFDKNGIRPISSQPGLAPTSAETSTDVNTSIRSTESIFDNMSTKSVDSMFDNVHLTVPQPSKSFDLPEGSPRHCHLCHRRLFHVETNKPISMENRKRFIADGDMYEAVADLCQEYAHEVMCEEFQLEWVTVEDHSKDGEVPRHRPHDFRVIRALVNSDHPLIETSTPSNDCQEMVGRPTILIATGRGKVQAGIFSRQHLICTSLESSTALPIVREAKARKLNVVIPDPNAHGERFGYDTFQKTMKKLFTYWDEPRESSSSVEDGVPLQERDIYVLSHSASGSQVARYLLDKKQYIPHIRAIAFTDSTHNIQWAKTPEHSSLYNLLESDRCIYFRCANEQRDANWYLHQTGEEIKTDEFWQHRFGRIKTYWAGTNEHSLTNWYAHAKIWQHFDHHLSSSLSQENSPPPPPQASS